MNVTSSGGLPGLDLLEIMEEPESADDKAEDGIKKEPSSDVEQESSGVFIKKEPGSETGEVTDATDKQGVTGVTIKEEPMDADESNNQGQDNPPHEITIKEEPMDADESGEAETENADKENDADEGRKVKEEANGADESPATPLIDEPADTPVTSLEDENPEMPARPEPERIRIVPQTGSAISLNLCKSTVDSGLVPPADKSSAKDVPPSQSEEPEGEEELVLPPPDPRFAIQEPVLRCTELSGLCSIM